MHFDLTEDQRALVAGIRDLCAGAFPLDKVQALADDGAVDDDGWRALSDAGVFSLRRAEDSGGIGLGMVEAALVFAELGAALVPGPLLGTHLAAGHTDAARVGLVFTTERPTVLAHPDVVDAVLVVRDGAVTLVGRSELDLRPVSRPLDPLTPLAVVAEMPAGQPIADGDDARRLQREGAVLAAALLLGVADAVTRRSTDYAQQREQFGRPIGSFQAVKHLLADMLVRTEVTRAAVYSAAVHLDDPQAGDVDTAVSAAKLLASDTAVANAKAAVQIHGGMGFTWEVPVHLYLKRAAVLATQFGTGDDHAESLAGTLLGRAHRGDGGLT